MPPSLALRENFVFLRTKHWGPHLQIVVWGPPKLGGVAASLPPCGYKTPPHPFFVSTLRDLPRGNLPRGIFSPKSLYSGADYIPPSEITRGGYSLSARPWGHKPKCGVPKHPVIFGYKPPVSCGAAQGPPRRNPQRVKKRIPLPGGLNAQGPPVL